MIREGFQDKLLLRLSMLERARLEVEAVRKKSAPRPKSAIWSDIRRHASWSLRQDLRAGAKILACVLIALLALNISPVLFALWILVPCFVMLYGVCRLLYVSFAMAYVFLTWRRRE
ncbi:hypothetical protein [Shinella sp.]|uniref:hypothetical protein n=1 Tax=Shinella sp. TaxID=1870904 RepID=UPI003F71E7B2